MKPNEFRDLVYKTFINAWDVEVSLFTLDNEKFTPPDDAPDGAEPLKGRRWVRLCVRHGETNQKTLGPVGARKFEHTAKVILQIFTSPNSGTKDADELNQAFQELFDTDLGRGDVFGGTSSYRERGTADGWFMAESTVTYSYDEIR